MIAHQSAGSLFVGLDVIKDIETEAREIKNAGNILAKMECATKTRTRGCRPNEMSTVRYLRRAVAIERRAEADLTGHHFWSKCPRTVAF